MKKLPLLLALLTAGLSGNALAQTMDYRVTHVSEIGMSAMDLGALQRNSETSILAVAQIFYPTAHVGYGNSVDYTIAFGEYDCTAPGRWRLLNIVGFESGVGEPVADQQDLQAQWQVHNEGSLGHANWVGACKGVAVEYRLPFDFANVAGREEALRYYRDFMQKKR